MTHPLIEAVARAIARSNYGYIDNPPEPVVQAREDEDWPFEVDTALAAIRSIEAAGWVIVPETPTTEMLHAATAEIPTWDDEASQRKYRAMISARPRIEP